MIKIYLSVPACREPVTWAENFVKVSTSLLESMISKVVAGAVRAAFRPLAFPVGVQSPSMHTYAQLLFATAARNLAMTWRCGEDALSENCGFAERTRRVGCRAIQNLPNEPDESRPSGSGETRIAERTRSAGALGSRNFEICQTNPTRPARWVPRNFEIRQTNPTRPSPSRAALSPSLV